MSLYHRTYMGIQRCRAVPVVGPPFNPLPRLGVPGPLLFLYRYPALFFSFPRYVTLVLRISSCPLTVAAAEVSQTVVCLSRTVGVQVRTVSARWLLLPFWISVVSPVCAHLFPGTSGPRGLQLLPSRCFCGWSCSWFVSGPSVVFPVCLATALRVGSGG